MIQRKGKSSIKLIVAIVIIVALVTAGVIYLRKFLSNESIKDLQYDMLLVKTKTETVKSKNVLNKDENPLIGYQLTSLPENINIDEFKAKNVIGEDEYEKYYLLDSECLEKMDLKELVNKYPGYFIVCYDDYEVIYSKGYENKNKMWCYKISDLEKKPENKKLESSIPASTEEQTNNEETTENSEQTENAENSENTEGN